MLDSRLFGQWKKLQYLIEWKGYDDQCWESAEDVNGLAIIERFHMDYPDKPSPLPED
jgi:hypothetical protein